MATVKVIPAMRASYAVREGESEAEHDNKARQSLHQPGPCPTVAEQDKQGKPGNGSQVQPRVQVTRQVCGYEAGLKSSHKMRSGDGNQNRAQASNCQTSL